MKKKFFGIILFVLCMGFVLVGCAEKLDVEELYDIEARGANGYGSVELVINEAYANQVMNDKMNALSDRLKSEYKRKGLHTFPPYQYINTLDYEIIDGDDGKLSNGDEITIQISENENLADEVNMKLSKKEIKYTVEGLREPRKIDVFKGVSFRFDGDDGEGTGYFSSKSSELPIDVEYKVQVEDEANYYYEIYNLSNGQKVQVIAEFDEQAALENGYIVEEKTKEFTVEGLKEYEIVDADTIFEGFAPSFSGASPKLEMRVENTLPDDLYGYFNFYVDPSYDLEIGDIVTITAEADQTALKEKGKSFPDGMESREYELTEDLVPRYLSDLSELSAEDIAFLKQEADDHMTKTIADLKTMTWGYYFKFGDNRDAVETFGTPTIDSAYLLYPKESMIDQVGNNISRLVFLYKCVLTSEKGANIDAYHAVSYKNLIIDPVNGLNKADYSKDSTHEFNDRESEFASFVDSWRSDYSVKDLTAADFE